MLSLFLGINTCCQLASESEPRILQGIDMKLIQFFLISFMCSCAHYYKGYSDLKTSPVVPKNFSISPSLVVKYKPSLIYISSKESLEKHILPKLFPITVREKADYELLSIDIKRETVNPACNNGYPGLLILFVLSAGIIPMMSEHAIEAEFSYKDNASGAIHNGYINADHTQGVGWLYWIRAWSSDNWNWTEDIPVEYRGNDVIYFQKITAKEINSVK